MSLKVQLERQVRFFHPQQKYPFLRGGFDSNAHAALFGLRGPFYDSIKAAFAARVTAAATELAQDSHFCQQVNTLPLKSGSKVVALGDSLTDDSLSWFSILASAFELIRPDKEIQWTNLAVSGETTTQLLGAVIAASQLQADLYLCLSGTNDARIQGGDEYKHCTSISEVERNLTSVLRFAQAETCVPWLWITPVGVDPSRVTSHDFFKPLRASWCNDHLDQVADLMVQMIPTCLDLRDYFRPAADSLLLDEDGLHWSIDGHIQVVRCVVDRLVNIL